MLRLIVPDSHGDHIDPVAKRKFFKAVSKLGQVDEVVLLGDHLDCGGFMSSHKRNYLGEMNETYAADLRACNRFLDQLQDTCPRARFHYLEGNHESHVERWCSRMFERHADAALVLEALEPRRQLSLVQRGIAYYPRHGFYDGLSTPGVIKLGKCHFTHGMSHSEHAAAIHLRKVRDNIVFGHVHRIQSFLQRTLHGPIGAWTFGTLAKVQPYYAHTTPTDHLHGFGFQDVLRSGKFQTHTEVLL